ncbi:hypothetical protein GOBAR_DD08100 [Gossypium barbadense]|nr:hypothetical protein GOBAR_DD08100 [Gossypium barbadense]
MDSWDEGTDCCKWEGVVCDNKKGNVIGPDCLGTFSDQLSVEHFPSAAFE